MTRIPTIDFGHGGQNPFPYDLEAAASTPETRPAHIYNDPQRRTGRSDDRDPLGRTAGLPPNLGWEILPHVYTFMGRNWNLARVYRPSDEAIRDSWANARYMRNDVGIMECLE